MKAKERHLEHLLVRQTTGSCQSTQFPKENDSNVSAKIFRFY